MQLHSFVARNKTLEWVVFRGDIPLKLHWAYQVGTADPRTGTVSGLSGGMVLSPYPV